MASPVNKNPLIPRPGHNAVLSELLRYDQELMKALFMELLQHAARLNLAFVNDGSEAMLAPARMLETTVAGLTAWPAASYDGGLIAVTNEAGGYTVAFSDGTNWRRVQDRVIVS